MSSRGTGDTDYSDARLAARFDEDLANNIGNLVNRTVPMVAKYRAGVVPIGTPEDPAASALRAARDAAASTIDNALRAFDFRRAVEAGGDVLPQASPVFPRTVRPGL